LFTEVLKWWPVVMHFICSLLLMPGQSFLAIGIEVLLIGLLDWMPMFLLQLISLRKMQAQYRRAFVRSIVVCQIAALSFVTAGIILLISGRNDLY
jgi:hypothetical protein